jgi:hypothetical protein
MTVLGAGQFVESNTASAALCDIGQNDAVRQAITGTTTIASFGAAVNRLRFLRFTGILTLTHNATSLKLPGAANITTAAGDTAIAMSDPIGNWTITHYTRSATAP